MKINLLIVAFLLSPVSAFAGADPADVAAINQCLHAFQDSTNPQEYVGKIRQSCSEKPYGDTMEGMTACVVRETAAWDVQMVFQCQAARDYATSLDTINKVSDLQYAVRFDQPAIAQESWITFRDANCQSFHSIKGSAAISALIGADCRMKMTAKRTIELAAYYWDYAR